MNIPTTSTMATSSSNPIRVNLHYMAWAQALIATTASLIFSEVLGFIPCVLCWYQRILMYPLVLILTVGILLRDTRLRLYVLPLSLLGWAIGLYHSLLYYGAIPEEFHICTTGVPCETRWIEWLGFIGIPLLSFTGFTVITLAMLWHRPGAETDHETQETREVPKVLRTGLSAFIMIAFSVVIAVGLWNRSQAGVEPTNTFGSASTAAPTTSTEVAVPGDDARVNTAERLMQGEQVFSRQCAACHGTDARGLPNLGLPLVDSAFLRERSDSELLELIVTGRLPSDTANQTGMIMPGKGGNPILSDEDILAVIAYLRTLNP